MNWKMYDGHRQSLATPHSPAQMSVCKPLMMVLDGLMTKRLITLGPGGMMSGG
jgi:hypothetical protein